MSATQNFGIFTSQPPQVVVAPMRVPSDIENIKGTFKSETDGTFVFLFDNKFSWFNSKLLSYTVNLFQVCVDPCQLFKLLNSLIDKLTYSDIVLMTFPPAGVYTG